MGLDSYVLMAPKHEENTDGWDANRITPYLTEEIGYWRKCWWLQHWMMRNGIKTHHSDEADNYHDDNDYYFRITPAIMKRCIDELEQTPYDDVEAESLMPYEHLRESLYQVWMKMLVQEKYYDFWFTGNW